LIQAQQSVEYFDAINSEWVGWNFDIGNAGRVGPAERWIQVIGKRILRIHVKDYSAKPADPAAGGNARPKLLDGDTTRPAVMKALHNAGYAGWAISEQPGNQAADVETARDLAQRMDRIFAL
jgi:hexulose-6-phosphate isomerase